MPRKLRPRRSMRAMQSSSSTNDMQPEADCGAFTVTSVFASSAPRSSTTFCEAGLKAVRRYSGRLEVAQKHARKGSASAELAVKPAGWVQQAQG